MLGWFVIIFGLIAMASSAVAQTFSDEKERESLVVLSANTPTILFLRGLPQGSDVDQIVFFTMFAFLAVLAGIMFSFLAIRHTRSEEDLYRAHLVASTRIGRVLPLGATVVYGLVAVVVCIAVSWVAFVVADTNPAGALRASLALGAVALVFFSIGLVCGQIAPNGRSARSSAIAVIMTTYLLRGLGDSTGTITGTGVTVDPSWVSWLSPIGWAQMTYPFSQHTYMPLLLHVILAIILITGTFVSQARRDLDASLLSVRRGRLHARGMLSNPFGLAWRLHWITLVAWSLAGVIIGVVSGIMASVIEVSFENPALESMSELFKTIGSDSSGTLSQTAFSAMFVLVSVLGVACATQALLRLSSEESSGVASAVLSTASPRLKWIGSFFVLAVACLATVLLSAYLGAVSVLAVTQDTGISFGDIGMMTLAQLPAGICYVGLVGLVYACLPHRSVLFSWGLVIFGIFVGIFGDALGLPDWLQNLSPFTHAPVVIGDVDWSGGWIMIAVGLLAMAGAGFMFQKRDVIGR